RVSRTLIDLAGALHPARTERAVDNCLAARTVTLGALRAAFIDLARPGRRGIALMRRLLDDRSDGYVPPASELEACFVALLRSHGLPEPARQVDVGDELGWVGRVDFAYTGARTVIELDSRRHHSSKLDVEADEARDLRLRAAGWQVERFRWDDLIAVEPVVSLIRSILGDSVTI
ncbi:MAG: endonuclease domain-containing protein, partial [Actinomycetota bacterium]|nr:endonuclease domain-containing protein [Actinomycetota bacterium]